MRNTKTSRPVKKLSVTLSDGAKPSIGTTLTPVKAPRAKKVPAKVAKVPRKAKKTLKVDAVEKKAVKPVKKALVKVAKAPPKPKKVVKSAPVVESAPPVVALRRGRHPVNPEADFALFAPPTGSDRVSTVR